MEYSIKEMDEMCIRLNNLSQELLRRRSTPEVLNLIISEAVDLVQRIGGSLAWAYGSAKGARWGEQFVQPFVDRRVTERFRELLMTGNAQLQAQVLQTIHILLQSTRSESTLFCNLTAGWYLNQVVAADYDFRNNEDLLHLWMTVVKDIALMMDKENLMLFFDPAAERPFPIFAQSAQFYHHPVAQVRTQVQATSLEIFTKLKSADAWMEDLFGLVVADSKILFTHVVCLLRHFWRKTEEAARSNERKEKQEHMRLQNDVLMYLADVFTCEVPELNIERLLRFAVLPVLLGSALQLQQLQHAMLSQETSWAVFCDFLQTLRSCHQLQVLLATVLFRHYVTDEVLQLVTSPALRTPVAYFELQKFWGGRSHGGVCDGYDAHRPDSVLYESIPIRFATWQMLRQDIASEPRRANRLCKAFLERTGELYEKGRVKAAINALRCMTMLLEAFGASNEALEKTVAEEMGTHGEVCWSLCLAALRALRQLMEVPGSHSALPSLRPDTGDRFRWMKVLKVGAGVVAMDPEISSCPDSPDRDPSLEFCNDWEEPRDLLLKAMQRHHDSLNEQLLELRVQVQQLSEGLDSKRSNDRLGEMRRSSTQSNASAGLPARSHSYSTKKAGKDSLAMEVLQMDMSHLGTPMRSLSLKKIVPPRGSRSNSKKPEDLLPNTAQLPGALEQEQGRQDLADILEEGPSARSTTNPTRSFSKDDISKGFGTQTSRSLSKDEDTLSLSIVPKSSTSDPRDKTVLFRGGSAGSALLEVAEKNSRGDDAESSREDPQSPKDSKEKHRTISMSSYGREKSRRSSAILDRAVSKGNLSEVFRLREQELTATLSARNSNRADNEKSRDKAAILQEMTNEDGLTSDDDQDEKEDIESPSVWLRFSFVNHFVSGYVFFGW
eukprot:symbB.v1.2.003442.t1/scaffold194.1/size275082/3